MENNIIAGDQLRFSLPLSQQAVSWEVHMKARVSLGSPSPGAPEGMESDRP